MIVSVIGVVLWIFSHSITAQLSPVVELPPGILTSGVQPQSRSERAINEIQASLIYSMFTKPMFDINAVLQEEDEEETILSNKQSKEFVNQLLARVLAEDLARQDMLKLREQLKRQLGL